MSMGVIVCGFLLAVLFIIGRNGGGGCGGCAED